MKRLIFHFSSKQLIGKFKNQMKYLPLLFLCLSANLFSQAPGEKIFDNSLLHEIHFQFSQANYWQQMEQNFEQNFDPFDPVPYIIADVSIDGELVDSVGVRFKGFTSYPFGQNKKPFKIDFNEFVPGKRYDGLRKLNLNNATGDPGMQRDVICYDLLNANDVNAPRTSFAKVFINDVYLGLYQVIEQVDKEFLQRNFDDDDGNLFKNKSWSKFEWLGSDVEAYKGIFQLKTNKEEDDWSGFINFIDVLNNSSNEEFASAIEGIFNVDLFLKTLAVDVATNNWDSYLEHGRNWYIYEDLSTGIFHWIPWDYNFALGGAGFGGLGDGEDCEIFPFFADFTDGSRTVEFYDLSFASGDELEYKWDFGDGMTSDELEPIHTYAEAGPYEVCLTISSGPDCSEKMCEFIYTTWNINECPGLAASGFNHENKRALAIVLKFNEQCCNQWIEECEEDYQAFAGNQEGGFNFAIDQRENEGILIKRLLNVPEFYNRYLKFYCNFLEEDFVYEKYSALIDHNKDLIQVAVELDTNSLFSYETFLEDLSETGIKEILQKRIDTLNIQLEELNACGTVNLNESQKSPKLELSPNPVRDIFQVSLDEPNKSQKLNLEIISSSGHLIEAVQINTVDLIKVDVNHLSNGFYFLNVQFESGDVETFKFVKVD